VLIPDRRRFRDSSLRLQPGRRDVLPPRRFVLDRLHTLGWCSRRLLRSPCTHRLDYLQVDRSARDRLPVRLSKLVEFRPRHLVLVLLRVGRLPHDRAVRDFESAEETAVAVYLELHVCVSEAALRDRELHLMTGHHSSPLVLLANTVVGVLAAGVMIGHQNGVPLQPSASVPFSRTSARRGKSVAVRSMTARS